jgi:hypothetical protein
MIRYGRKMEFLILPGEVNDVNLLETGSQHESY